MTIAEIIGSNLLLDIKFDDMKPKFKSNKPDLAL